jgi:hypothetical protein
MTSTEGTGTQRVPCPGCGMPVDMPAAWPGYPADESLCNACAERAEQEA